LPKIWVDSLDGDLAKSHPQLLSTFSCYSLSSLSLFYINLEELRYWRRFVEKFNKWQWKLAIQSGVS